jgi:hypothetical protein
MIDIPAYGEGAFADKQAKEGFRGPANARFGRSDARRANPAALRRLWLMECLKR